MKKLKAKPVSLVAQIIAAIWVAAWSAFKFIMHPELITIDEIAMSGFFIVLCFSPVAISIILDKIKLIRFGDTDILTKEETEVCQPTVGFVADVPEPTKKEDAHESN